MDAQCINLDLNGKPSRIRYERDLMLSFKAQAAASDADIVESLPTVSAATQRNGRAKQKQFVFSKGQNGRSRGSAAIFLGPQKRSWNTGCHVSHSGGRETGDSCGRSARRSSDPRNFERPHNQFQNDCKREFRGSGRDRGTNRRTDVSFCRSYCDDHQKQSTYDEEPEWFTGGPTTVSETIELGGILELDEEKDHENCNTNDSSRRQSTGTDVQPVGDEMKDGEASLDVHKSKHSPVGSSQEDTVTSSQPLLAPENQGSRFKHLFNMTSTDVNKTSSALPISCVTSDDINDQLLRLLKGSVGINVSSSERNNVVQIENKLRSILLGRTSTTKDDSQKNVPHKDQKPKILTVEEIESELILSTATSNSNVPTGADVQTEVAEDMKHPFPMKTQSTQPVPSPHLTSGSNLVPIMKSIVLKQQQTCSKSPLVHGALNPFGILSNPMIHIPTSTNAVSASARINQLNQTELNASSGVGDLGQGLLRHIWENSGDTSSSAPQAQVQMASAGNLPPQSSIGPSTNLHSELGFNSSLGISSSCLPPNHNALTAPRRPIVKAQQNVTLQQPNHTPSIGVPSPNFSSQRYGICPQDVSQCFLNLTTRQQRFHTNGAPPNMCDKPMIHSMFSLPNNEVRLHSPNTQQYSDSSSLQLFSNNSNTYLPQGLLNTRPQSENTLSFLSQLVDMDRSGASLGYPKPSSSTLSSLLTASMKAKTLEEIEHQEISNAATFF